MEHVCACEKCRFLYSMMEAEAYCLDSDLKLLMILHIAVPPALILLIPKVARQLSLYLQSFAGAVPLNVRTAAAGRLVKYTKEGISNTLSQHLSYNNCIT